MSISLTAAATAAAQFLGVLDSGESLSAQQLADILAATNNMLDNWSSEGLFALSDVLTTWNMAGGTQNYTIGSAQVINIPRPVRIVAASFTNASGPGGAIDVVDEKTWTKIPDRQRQSWIVEKLFWDRGTPTGNVYVSPIPLGTLVGQIHTWAALTQFPDTTTPITMAPGYTRMVELGIAIEVAAQFSMAVPQTTAANFADAAARVRKLNASLLGEVPEEIVQESK